MLMEFEIIFSQEKGENLDFTCYKMFKWHWNTYGLKR